LYKNKNKYLMFFSLLLIICIPIASGTRIFSDIYYWLVFTFPVEWILRSPEKLIVLIILPTSILLVFSFTEALSKLQKKTSKAHVLISIILILLISLSNWPLLTGDFAGDITPVMIPNEFSVVNSFFSISNNSKVLWMPRYWGRSANWNPGHATSIFNELVSIKPTYHIEGDPLKVYYFYTLGVYYGPYSVLSKNHTNYLGKYLAPLNIKYLILHDDIPSLDKEVKNSLVNMKIQDLELIANENFIYLYRNADTPGQFYIPNKIILVTDGLEKFTSLNTLDLYSPQESSLIFLNQQLKKELFQYNTNIIITTESDDLVIPIVLSSLDYDKIIKPFESTFNHNPSFYWSIAMTGDPLHGEWHTYLESRGIENWDFDHGEGLVFTWATSRLNEISTPSNNDSIKQWLFNSNVDVYQWKNYTRETQFGALQNLILDNVSLRIELLNSTWGWKTINSPLIPAEYSNWYRWELQIKGENAHGVHFKIAEYNQEQKIIKSKQVNSVGSGNFDWTTINIDYTPEKPETKYIQLQIWHGHETTQPRPNTIWLDHLKVYDLQNFIEPVTLDIPYTLPQTDQYIILARVFQNQQGGKILVQNDNEDHVVNTRDQLNRFTWIQLDNTTLQKGQHKITLTNLEGFNAVNLFALVPAQKYCEAQTRLTETLQDKRIIHILEAESDMYRENTSSTNKYGGEASNGETLEIAPDSKTWREIETLKPGNYTIAVRGRGNLIIKIDEQEYQTYTDHLDWTYIGPIHLEKGTPRIEIISPLTYLAQWNFEKDKPLEWKGNISNVQTLSQSQRPYKGATSLEVEMYVSTWGWKTITSPLISITPDTKYTWSLQIAGENAHKAHIKIIEYNENKKPLTGKQVVGIGDGNFTWIPISFDYTPTQNATYIALQIWHGHETTQPLPNRIWLDEVQVTGYKPSDLDVVWLYSVNKENETLEDIFKADEPPAELLEYIKINPTKYTVKINSTKPFMLSFAESYDPLWVARVDGEKISAIPLYSVINGFWIEETGFIDVTIEYEPQRWFYMGSAISITTLIACAIYLTHDWTKNKVILKRLKKWLRSNSS